MSEENEDSKSYRVLRIKADVREITKIGDLLLIL